ncbi:MAG TPA: SOS response-associated peptidase family protein, partial [Anaerolineales bacterium]|nr:SOS response-associated peptidase family protein [Anaerolineales bacterium]
GLWETWQSSNGSEIPSCTIITCEPNELIREIHNRMPVILPEESCQLWLDPGEPDLNLIKALLRQYPAENMSAYPVSKLVNNPANDTAACIQPL